jgi:hypothetical protein
LRFIGSMLWFCCFAPDDGELQEKICLNFVQKWPKQNQSLSLFCRVRALLIIYILHNNICLMCLICLLCLLCLFILLNFNIVILWENIFKVLIMCFMFIIYSCKSKSNTTKRIN